MADVHNKKTRSYNMSRIKGKNTKPEILVRQFLHKNGYRYRINYSKLPGKPDIVLPKYKTVLFINGCFWHGHENCKDFVVPKTKTEWWLNKINGTKERDLLKTKALETLNWRVKVIWECELNTGKRDKVFDDLIVFLMKKQ